MIDGIRLKFCGLRSLVDIEFADRLGADYLGFILYPKSSRSITLQAFRDMATLLPDGRETVAVMVEPSAEELRQTMVTGFDRAQIHFSLPVAEDTLKEWIELVGRDRLWLAPKLPPEQAMPESVLNAAATILWDTYHKGGFGGSGKTGDWAKFSHYKTARPEITWILAGGISADTVEAALKASGTTFLDLSSGVEVAPGIKDHVKMKALVRGIHRARSSPTLN